MNNSIRSCLIIFFLAFGSRLLACDVNLFSLISGDSKEKNFIEATTKLAVASKELNENLKTPEAGQKLESLMTAWLDFSNTYSVFPPEWGKDDIKWKSKFTESAKVLGEIRKYSGNNYPAAHDEILKFSRRLSRFYEKMSLSEEAAVLLDFTYAVDDLWLAFDKKDKSVLYSLALHLNKLTMSLSDSYGKLHNGFVDNISDRISKLLEYTKPETEFREFPIRILISSLEEDLTKLNEDISVKKTFSGENK